MKFNNFFSVLVLKLFVPPIIWDILKIFYKKIKPYYGLNNLDHKLLKYLNYHNGYYVELGANDGITASNTLFFERSRHWGGVLVEPIPHKYLECIKNRSTANEIHCNACTSFEFDEKFVEIIYSNTMSISLGLETDIPNAQEHISLGEQFLANGERSFSFGAKSKTLNQILIDSNSPKVIDFLSLDVEGSEIEVLKGLDFEKFQFKYMLIESRSISSIISYLTKFNYDYVENLTEHDYLFKYKLEISR